MTRLEKTSARNPVPGSIGPETCANCGKQIWSNESNPAGFWMHQELGDDDIGSQFCNPNDNYENGGLPLEMRQVATPVGGDQRDEPNGRYAVCESCGGKNRHCSRCEGSGLMQNNKYPDRLKVWPREAQLQYHPAPVEGEQPTPSSPEALARHLEDDHGVPPKEVRDSGLSPEAWHEGMHSEKNDADLEQGHWHFPGTIWDEHKPSFEYVADIADSDLKYYIPHCQCGWKSNIRSEGAAAGAWSRHVVTLDEAGRKQKAGPPTDRSQLPVPKRHASEENERSGDWIRCEYCNGSGQALFSESDGKGGLYRPICKSCKGSGVIFWPDRESKRNAFEDYALCNDCGGTGALDDEICTRCKGSGLDDRVVDPHEPQGSDGPPWSRHRPRDIARADAIPNGPQPCPMCAGTGQSNSDDVQLARSPDGCYYCKGSGTFTKNPTLLHDWGTHLLPYLEKNSAMNVTGTVYLLHFHQPISDEPIQRSDEGNWVSGHSTQHYIGWAEPGGLDNRIAQHRAGQGARLTQVAAERGIGFDVARTWEDVDRNFERRLKNQKHGPRLCPTCNPSKTAAFVSTEGTPMHLDLCGVCGGKGTYDKQGKYEWQRPGLPCLTCEGSGLAMECDDCGYAMVNGPVRGEYHHYGQGCDQAMKTSANDDHPRKGDYLIDEDAWDTGNVSVQQHGVAKGFEAGPTKPCPECGDSGEQDCSRCEGTGGEPGAPMQTSLCWSCDGTGCRTCKNSGITLPEKAPCAWCGGRKTETCDYCGGEGYIGIQNEEIHDLIGEDQKQHGYRPIWHVEDEKYTRCPHIQIPGQESLKIAHGDNEHEWSEGLDEPATHSGENNMEGNHGHYHMDEHGGYDPEPGHYFINTGIIDDDGNRQASGTNYDGQSLAWQKDTRKGFELNAWKTCERCKGNGSERCTNCGGDGVATTCEHCEGQGRVAEKEWSTHPDCDGAGCKECKNSGLELSHRCGQCGGRGGTKCDGCNGEGDITCPTCEGEGSLPTNLKDAHEAVWTHQHENASYVSVWHIKSLGSWEDIKVCGPKCDEDIEEWNKKFHKGRKEGSCPMCKGSGLQRNIDGLAGYHACSGCLGSGKACRECGFKDQSQKTASDDYDGPRCPACGDPIDTCRGHGEIGDPHGFRILERHDQEIHDECDPEGCDDAGPYEWTTCRSCKGTGKSEITPMCATCHGSGMDYRPVETDETCKRCGSNLIKGSGKCTDETCPYSDRGQNDLFTEGSSDQASVDECGCGCSYFRRSGEWENKYEICGRCQGKGDEQYLTQHDVTRTQTCPACKGAGLVIRTSPLCACGHPGRSHVLGPKESSWMDQVTAPYQQDAVKEEKNDIEPVLPPIYEGLGDPEDWRKIKITPVDVFSNPKTGAYEEKRYEECGRCSGEGCSDCNQSGLRKKIDVLEDLDEFYRVIGDPRWKVGVKTAGSDYIQCKNCDGTGIDPDPEVDDDAPCETCHGAGLLAPKCVYCGAGWSDHRRGGPAYDLMGTHNFTYGSKTANMYVRSQPGKTFHIWREHRGDTTSVCGEPLPTEPGRDWWIDKPDEGEICHKCESMMMEQGLAENHRERQVLIDKQHRDYPLPGDPIPGQEEFKVAQKIAATYYHVAPREMRESIEQHGIDYRGHSVRGDEDEYDGSDGKAANYLWKTQEAAENYIRDAPDTDVYEVTLPRKGMEKDPYFDVWPQDLEEYPGGAVRTNEPIHPSRVRRISQVQRQCVMCKKTFSESQHGEATGFCGNCREKEGLVDHHSWSEDAQEGHYGHNDSPEERDRALEHWDWYGGHEVTDDDVFHPLDHMLNEAEPTTQTLHRGFMVSPGGLAHLKSLDEVNLKKTSWTTRQSYAELLGDKQWPDHHGVVFHLTPGARAVRNTNNTSEAEWITRGRFKVDDIQKAKGVHHVFLTQVPEAQKGHYGANEEINTKTSMAFKPNRKYYKTDWDELPDKVYHVAPARAHDSIIEHGLNPSGRTHNLALSETDQSEGGHWKNDYYHGQGSDQFHYRPEGVYTFASPAVAADVAGYYSNRREQNHHIWEINVDSLRAAQRKPAHKTDVIRDPEVFQADWEGQDREDRTHEDPDDFWRDQRHGENARGDEVDNRQFVFEKVHPDHLKLVKPYTIKPHEDWTDDDMDDYQDDHEDDGDDGDDGEHYGKKSGCQNTCSCKDTGVPCECVDCVCHQKTGGYGHWKSAMALTPEEELPQHLQDTISEFRKLPNVHRLTDPDEAHMRCGPASKDFANFAESRGHDVEIRKLRQDPWQSQWAQDHQREYDNYIGYCHSVPFVDGHYVDWTARQYEPKSPVPRIYKNLKDGDAVVPKRPRDKQFTNEPFSHYYRDKSDRAFRMDEPSLGWPRGEEMIRFHKDAPEWDQRYRPEWLSRRCHEHNPPCKKCEAGESTYTHDCKDECFSFPEGHIPERECKCGNYGPRGGDLGTTWEVSVNPNPECPIHNGEGPAKAWFAKNQKTSAAGKTGYVACKTCGGSGRDTFPLHPSETCSTCKGSGLIDAYSSTLRCLKPDDGSVCQGRIVEHLTKDGQRRTWCPDCDRTELHGPMYNEHGERCPLCKSSDETYDGKGGVSCNNCTWQGTSRKGKTSAKGNQAIIGVGIPGSGKSTFLKPYAERIGAPYLSTDAIRAEINGSEETYGQQETDVFDTLYQRMHQALDTHGKVVVDATYTEPAYRRIAIDHLRQKADEVHAIVFDTPLDVAKQRNQGRDRKVPDEVIERMHANLQQHPPTEAEGLTSITHVPYHEIEDEVKNPWKQTSVVGVRTHS